METEHETGTNGGDEKAKRKMIGLKDREKAALWGWLQSIRTRIEPEKLYPKKLAEMAAAEPLKMPHVTRFHVRHALAILGLPVVRSPHSGSDRTTAKQRGERLAALETRCDQLEQRCLKLENENAALVKLVEETAARIEAKARECATGTRHAPPVLRGGISSTNRT